jgi:hypothetical protein
MSPKSTMMTFIKRQSSHSNIEDIPSEGSASTLNRSSGESQVEGDLRKRRNKECEADYKTLARKETKVVNVLRVLALVLLFVTATLTSVGVYFYTSNDEKQEFESVYQANAQRLVESFHGAVERRLGAINSMTTAITSYSLDTKQTFPLVTCPNFEIRGSDLRVQTADATSILWLPLVTDETRVAWEEYALTNHSQFDKSFLEDAKQREKQDDEFGLSSITGNSTAIELLLSQSQESNILDDGTGYHPIIWSNGAISPPGDETEGSGPYIPVWQRR